MDAFMLAGISTPSVRSSPFSPLSHQFSSQQPPMSWPLHNAAAAAAAAASSSSFSSAATPKRTAEQADLYSPITKVAAHSPLSSMTSSQQCAQSIAPLDDLFEQQPFNDEGDFALLQPLVAPPPPPPPPRSSTTAPKAIASSSSDAAASSAAAADDSSNTSGGGGGGTSSSSSTVMVNGVAKPKGSGKGTGKKPGPHKIQFIKSDSARLNRFAKRKNTIFNKIDELVIQTNASVYIVIETPGGALASRASGHFSQLQHLPNFHELLRECALDRTIRDINYAVNEKEQQQQQQQQQPDDDESASQLNNNNNDDDEASLEM